MPRTLFRENENRRPKAKLGIRIELRHIATKEQYRPGRVSYNSQPNQAEFVHNILKPNMTAKKHNKRKHQQKNINEHKARLRKEIKAFQDKETSERPAIRPDRKNIRNFLAKEYPDIYDELVPHIRNPINPMVDRLGGEDSREYDYGKYVDLLTFSSITKLSFR